MKKYFLISLGVVAAVGMLYLGYRLKSPTTENPNNNTNTPSLPYSGGAGNKSGNGAGLGPKAVLDKEVLAYFNEADGGILIFTAEGELIRVRDGKIEQVSSSTVASATGASFSYNGKRLLIGLGEPLSPTYRIFDLDKKSWRFLPFGAFSPVWSPKTSELAYLDLKANKDYLNFLDLDKSGSKPRQIASFSFEGSSLEWPSYPRILIKEGGASNVVSSVWSFLWSTKNTSPLVFEKQGVSISWEKGGERGLVLTGEGRGGSLILINNKGEGIKQFSFLTMPQKCVFSSDYLLCGVPENTKSVSYAFLPEAYEEEVLLTSDNIIKIDLNSGEIKTLLQNSGLDAIDMKTYGDKLYFVDRIGGRLYSLPL